MTALHPSVPNLSGVFTKSLFAARDQLPKRAGETARFPGDEKPGQRIDYAQHNIGGAQARLPALSPKLPLPHFQLKHPAVEVADEKQLAFSFLEFAHSLERSASR